MGAMIITVTAKVKGLKDYWNTVDMKRRKRK